MRTVTRILIAGTLVVILTPILAAQTIPTPITTSWQYNPALPGAWFDANNWSLGLPTATLAAQIANGGIAVLDDPLKDAAAASLKVGTSYVGGGTLLQRRGSLAITGDISLGAPDYMLYQPVQPLYMMPTPLGVRGRYDLYDGSVKANAISLSSSYGYYPIYSATDVNATGAPSTYVMPGPGSLMQQFGGAVNLSSLDINGGTLGGPIPMAGTTTAYPIPAFGSTYNLIGGALNTGWVDITAAGGSASLFQCGGTLSAPNGIDVLSAGGAATYRLAAGTVTTPMLDVGWGAVPLVTPAYGAAMPIFMPRAMFSMGGASANFSVTRSLSFDAGAAYSALWGSKIQMAGASLANQSTDPLSLGGLGQTSFVFTSGPQANPGINWQTFEVAGKDLGLTRQGFVGNFVTDSLQIGSDKGAGDVKLVDTFHNEGDANQKEALYVRKLVVGPGSELDLNGLDLYCLYASVDPTATILNGKILGGTDIGPITPPPQPPPGPLPPICIAPPLWGRNGDFNMDGVVDGVDFLTWQTNYKTGSGLSVAQGDADGDGVVDGVDFLIWQSNYRPGGTLAVPEPTALVLLGLGALAALRRSRRRD
jgi:hypothetical protein